jgi:hypothetical protein
MLWLCEHVLGIVCLGPSPVFGVIRRLAQGQRARRALCALLLRHRAELRVKTLHRSLIVAAAVRGPSVGGRQTDHAGCQVRCRARCLFISNMVTLSLPKTLLSLSSARISRRFSGFCRLWDLM